MALRGIDALMDVTGKRYLYAQAPPRAGESGVTPPWLGLKLVLGGALLANPKAFFVDQSISIQMIILNGGIQVISEFIY